MSAGDLVDYWQAEGRKAHAEGVPRRNNPFSGTQNTAEEERSHAFRNSWWRGWDAAQKATAG